jgi:uncharacterized protein
MDMQSGREGEAADAMTVRSEDGTAVSAPRPSPFSPPHPPPDATPSASGAWGLGAAAGVWAANLALSFLIPAIFLVVYALLFNPQLVGMVGGGQLPASAVIATLVGTFAAQVLTLGLCWLVVTHGGRQPFFAPLGWSWHPQFKWVHAVGLAFLMLLLGGLLEKTLPHRPTDLERLLQISASVRISVALLATFGAPLVEEVVYRGILYSSLERVAGRGAGVAVVTLLFTLVHVPQYWGSVATITAILLLSVVLTLLRALTGSLLACVATHFVFNAIQSAIIVFVPSAAPKPDPQAAVTALWAACGH